MPEIIVVESRNDRFWIYWITANVLWWGGGYLVGSSPGLQAKPQLLSKADLGSHHSEKGIVSRPSAQDAKAAFSLELNASRSRLFKLKNTIVRLHIEDPEIAEPVVLAQHEVVFLGKAPGVTKADIWDEFGQHLCIAVRVVSGDSWADETPINRSDVQELKVTQKMVLRLSTCQMIQKKDAIVRTSLSDPRIAIVRADNLKELRVRGTALGHATLFVWDQQGNVEGIDLRVEPRGRGPFLAPPARIQLPVSADPTNPKIVNMERWDGTHKKIYHYLKLE
jgi:Flp pilus assembly secretin CpaC